MNVTDPDIKTISKSDVAQVTMFAKQALTEAELVPDYFLANFHPEMRKRFKKEYQACLILLLKSLKTRNKQNWPKG